MRRLSAIGAALSAALAASAANAVVAPFGGPATGTDPLGQPWTTSNAVAPAWGEPGLAQGTLTFNPGNISNSLGTFATEFDFIFLKGVNGGIDTTPASGPFGFETTTRFSDVTQGVLWAPVFVSNKEVHFVAPAGTRINAGDEFFVNIAFTGPVDLKQFSFAGLWTDLAGGVPEPSTWAMMLTGLGLLGAAMRVARRRQAAAPAGA